MFEAGGSPPPPRDSPQSLFPEKNDFLRRAQRRDRPHQRRVRFRDLRGRNPLHQGDRRLQRSNFIADRSSHGIFLCLAVRVFLSLIGQHLRQLLLRDAHVLATLRSPAPRERSRHSRLVRTPRCIQRQLSLPSARPHPRDDSPHYRRLSRAARSHPHILLQEPLRLRWGRGFLQAQVVGRDAACHVAVLVYGDAVARRRVHLHVVVGHCHQYVAARVHRPTVGPRSHSEPLRALRRRLLAQWHAGDRARDLVKCGGSGGGPKWGARGDGG